jgi:hypothetical protein
MSGMLLIVLQNLTKTQNAGSSPKASRVLQHNPAKAEIKSDEAIGNSNPLLTIIPVRCLVAGVSREPPNSN